ncbi:MAG: hypothetical protein AAGI53_03965 [Planctomycetota bacterium]
MPSCRPFAAVVLLAAVALGCRAEGLLDGSRLDALSAAPWQARFVMVADDLASEAKRPEAETLIEQLEGTGMLAKTPLAWAEFAERLGLPASEAFSRVFRGRVMFAWSPADDPGDRDRWLLVAQLDAATARRMLVRLDTSPRDTVAGVTTLAVESGSLSLALVPMPSADGSTPKALVLAPNGAEADLRAAVRTLRADIKSFMPAPKHARERGGVAMLYRSASGDAIRSEVLPVERGWRAKFIADDPATGVVQPPLLPDITPDVRLADAMGTFDGLIACMRRAECNPLPLLGGAELLVYIR